MTGILGACLLLLVVAVALRLLSSGKLKPALLGVGLIVVIGCMVPVIIPAVLSVFLRGLIVLLAIVGAFTVLVAIVHLLLHGH